MEKACAKCKGVFPLSMFNKNRSKSDGLGTECRPCSKANSNKYFQEHREEHRERGRLDYEKNREERIAGVKAWRAANPDKVRQIKAAYREKYREQIKAISQRDWEKHAPKRRAKKAEWRAANPDKALEHVRARQTRKTQQMPPWADREAILAVYREARRLTKETGVKHHVDHYYPLKGEIVSGLHVHFNLRPIPAPDNHRKGNKMPKENL